MAETSSSSPTGMKPTLGLTGLTSNAMALIAPGAFLWLTYAQQSAYGAPMAGSAMWLGIGFALLLCLATAVAYAELSKLYPGAGSSYFFAEQAFLSKKQAFKWARVAKFMVGWASHLYYWVYPGVMVGVTAIIAGYMIGQIFPNTFNSGQPSALFMILFCVVFSFGVAYIAFRGVGGTTGVNAAINIVQIAALLLFTAMAITHRLQVKEGQPAWTLDSTGTPTKFVQATEPNTIADPKDSTKQIPDPAGGTHPKVDASGAPVWDIDPATKQPKINTISYEGGIATDDKGVSTFDFHPNARSILAPHGYGGYVIIQACIAILILVGFESVTSMGEEAKNAKRDIPKAVILALVIQGGFCYLLEYFGANFFLSSAYKNTTAAGSSAPIGDMMQLVGAWAFDSARAGWWFMMIQAVTVFLALIGTTLACMSTGARVTYAMGRDEEVPNHFGMLHGKNLTPHRAIWTLAIISIVIGIYASYCFLCGPAATAALDTNLTDAMKAGPWYKFGAFSSATAGKIPNSLLITTLISNFGTFLLYMMTCIVAIVAFREHHSFHGFKHVVIPVFGLVANLGCMLFYLIGPKIVAGMSSKEPWIALGFAAVWGIYGLIYFKMRSRKTGKTALITVPPTSVGAGA
ncbi:MAG: Amino acid permease [Phycisphaerales bacterium]|nr:Amino acid permease [Phycisphaerales bacterium]